MLSLEEIGQSVRNNLQLILDSYGLKLAVGPVTDQDYKILCGGFGELEWDFGFSQHGNHPDKFEFCVKLVNTGVEDIPSGVALSVYSIEERVFRIHMIESFVRNDAEHPLKGRMVLLALMSAYIFCMAVNATEVQVVEPVAELVDYYASFGFVMHACGYVMTSEVSGLETAFGKFAQKQ